MSQTTTVTDEQTRLARELGVDRVYFSDTPAWFIRLTARTHLTWRRQVAFELGLLLVGLALGFLLGRT